MPQPHKPAPDPHAERLSELARIVQSALARHGASARSIAQRAGIGASHLSKFLKAQRSLRKAKLVVLADLLGLDRNKVLRLAGLGDTEESRLDVARVTLLRALDPFTLNVVVTAHSYDAALFLWIVSQQPFANLGVAVQLRRVEWPNVPAELASYAHSVGLHDQTPGLFRLARWSQLCLNMGHALIARGSVAARGKDTVVSLIEQARKKGRKPLLLSIDSALVELLRTTAGVGDGFDVQIIANPEVALESFRGGAGDLFLGGLAQRFALRKEDFRECIVHNKEHPRFYTCPSLICSERMLLEKRPLLHALDALWYDTCRRLYAEPDFREVVFHDISDLLERQGIEKHSLAQKDFEFLFTPEGRDFEIFGQTPAEVALEERRWMS